MSDGDSIILTLGELDKSLKGLNSKAKDLRIKKAQLKEKLYHWMRRRGHEEYQGYKLAKLEPKQKMERKKAIEKKDDALRLFEKVGIQNPEAFWEEFQTTQKASKKEEEN